MHSDVAISVENLTKTYRVFGSPADRIKQALTFGKVRFHRQFTALRNISFDINKGESVAIVGRNGSGKSSLLQLVCGILKPTSGSVQVNGRVCALLELGSGFNPEFTGRENVYFQGAVIGLSKPEMDARFQSILSFADIGEYIDQPVRTYSSGMFVRLAFAVIANVDADILVIDEALAVGDVFFQQKCMRFLTGFQEKGGTILFVSHDTSAVVGLCQRAILLGNQSGVTIGGAKEICQLYLRDFYKDRSQIAGHDFAVRIADERSHKSEPIRSPPRSLSRHVSEVNSSEKNSIQLSHFRADAESFGCQKILITDAWFENRSGARLMMVHGGDAINFCIRAQSLARIELPAFGFTIKNHLGQYVFSEDTTHGFRERALAASDGDTWAVTFSFLMPLLNQGDYSINVAAAEGTSENHVQHHWMEDVILLHSVNTRLAQGMCGLHELSIEIEIQGGDRAVET
jgi:lipopolysaccharide transport system ATP-binding protein